MVCARHVSPEQLEVEHEGDAHHKAHAAHLGVRSAKLPSHVPASTKAFHTKTGKQSRAVACESALLRSAAQLTLSQSRLSGYP